MSIKININQSCFRTPNFYLSAFLISKGIKLIDIENSNSPRSLFVLEESETRRSLAEKYTFASDSDDDLMVDGRKLINTIKILKDKLYQQRL